MLVKLYFQLMNEPNSLDIVTKPGHQRLVLHQLLNQVQNIFK